jgi:subtilisin family serine protease
MPQSLPSADGRGVRVAVIDSGVNPRHPHIAGIAGGVSITPDGVLEAKDWIDRLGHGTAVTAAIQEKAPAAEYFAVKVFHDALRTTGRNLVRAIEWAIDQQMDVINLSLGTRNPAHAELFRPLVERALAEGVTLVSARGCLPGTLPGVFAVDEDAECPRDRYRIDGEVFLASPYPRPVPGVPPERNLQGISFAVANFSGFVMRARGLLDSKISKLEVCRELLIAMKQGLGT